MSKLKDDLKLIRFQTDQLLDSYLPQNTDRSGIVYKAMRYSSIGGGKALRPFLIHTVGKMLNVSDAALAQLGCALEMVHTYSLIHDDLPAMDNDAVRRGKPSCHIQFDEATAILAGDGLLTKAFEIIADSAFPADSLQKCQLICFLAKSAGADGMIGGQAFDLSAAKSPLSEPEIYQMQRLKTGALLRFACTAPCLLAQCSPKEKEALQAFADSFGLLFQMTDDLLDSTGNEQIVGKTLSKDAAAHKSTLIALYGLDEAKKRIRDTAAQAIQALDPFGDRAAVLKELTQLIVIREK